MKSRRRGFTLSDVLVSLMFLGLILGVVWQELVSIMVGEYAAANTAQSAADNRMAVDYMADHVRNAVLNTSTSGVANSALSAASQTSFTYYTNATSLATVTYSLSGTNLVRTPSGGTAVTQLYDVSALKFSYYKATTYNSPWTSTANPNAPTTAELPYVCGILIDVTIVSHNVTSHILTTVRLRNAPLKVNVSGQ